MKKWLVLTLVLVCFLSSCKAAQQEKRPTVSNFSAAAFEYNQDNGYKLITSEIDSLDTFDHLMLKPAKMDFDGKWIYRITFNPRLYTKNAEEFIVLFGETCVSINGNTYIADGCPYSEILNWAKAKYEFFDYALWME